MGGVGKDRWCQRLLQVYIFNHLEYLLPHLTALHHLCVINPLTLGELVHLSQNNTVQNLLGRWQDTNWVIVVAKYQVSSRPKHFIVVPGAPIPCHPLQVLHVYQAKAVLQMGNNCMILVPVLSIGPLTILVFSTPDIKHSINSVGFCSFCCHFIKVYLSDLQQ